MTIECPDHGEDFIKVIKAGMSKKSGKPYSAFSVCDMEGCKFTGPAPDTTDEAETFTPTPILEAAEDDQPMKRIDWNVKEFIKGLGVFSSHARAEGMDPVTAFKTMSIWDWMDVAYGDMYGYEAWKANAKKRVK